MDPHLQLHMGNILSLQNRMQTAGMSNHLPSSLPGSLPPESLSSSMPSLQSSSLNAGGMPLAGMQGNMPAALGGNMNIPRPTSHGSQLQQKQQTQQKRNNVKKNRRDKEKKKKDQEEKQAKRDAEEKRKQEQRKQVNINGLFLNGSVVQWFRFGLGSREESRRREKEERGRESKEGIGKGEKGGRGKRMKELEEKRRLKEQRKAEEEARKKNEETRKLEEEKLRQEAKEMEARRQAEERRIQQEQLRITKAAPWSQSGSNLGMNLADIQKAEREKRAQEAALQVQRLQEKEYQQQQQQQQQEKASGIQLNWAKKPVEPRKVKSLAEIQAEEQERLAKQQAAESRLQKEKEAPQVTNNTGSIWNSQSLTWANTSNNSQWSSSNSGFWDDSSHRQVASKPSTVSKSNSTNTMTTVSKQQVQKQQTKSKTKKEEGSKVNHNNNNNAPSADEFTNWCYKTLSNITTSVDIPTFVTFLRDIESAYDVREYCKEYLGESTSTQQFASNFLEKRRSFKPKNNAHKDDMCSPAPAITPSLQHSTEFQEVKGKNKKNKKSKMLKVDSRILGFNVTSAPDRINVGDRELW
ncbi:hypothetical protein NQ318_014533 [Aromia moschata]|uniref:Uncharacterized protein n=1 Tax=Aromia moschata TaxID=1265417 RepID=A0AAV8YNY9_9CUCU|nr:hypothetical protein NQ318_014533 [Aromia moschata]